MVRLVITDFETREDNEVFYSNDSYESQREVFTFSGNKRNKVILPKSDLNDELYSLNLVSKKFVPLNRFLIYITDSEFFILFNHKTIYSAKINENFITDDMIKSVLISKHLTMLSSGGDIERIYYIIDSKFKFGIEHILRQNTKNEKGEVIAQELGNIENLVNDIPELETYKTYFVKMSTLLSVIVVTFWLIFYGFPQIEKKFFLVSQFTELKNDLEVEKRFFKRSEKTLNQTQAEFEEMISCVTNKENIVK